jgi:exopolyphosphatase/guanosine-5'-triphosphate,3'-diphosphate pyrophosphatase
VAAGADEEPEVAMSLPLGAGRLTRDWFKEDPPTPDEVRTLRRHVRAEIARHAGKFLRGGAPDHVVGTSKTFRQLARIAGAAPSSEGFYVKRYLKHSDVSLWAERLAAMTREERAHLPGVSEGRAGQMVAGAIVADAVMDLMGAAQLEICPWALREGVILKRLDTLDDSPRSGLPSVTDLSGPQATGGVGGPGVSPGKRCGPTPKGSSPREIPGLTAR